MSCQAAQRPLTHCAWTRAPVAGMLIRSSHVCRTEAGRGSLEDHHGSAGGGREPDSITLVAVSKTFDAPDIQPAIDAGQRVFGENRVQEAQGKWPGLKAKAPDIELHLIGPLQSNKAADAVALFDVIESVDREKIARALAAEIAAQERSLRVYIQVNTGMGAAKGWYRAG